MFVCNGVCVLKLRHPFSPACILPFSQLVRLVLPLPTTATPLHHFQQRANRIYAVLVRRCRIDEGRLALGEHVLFLCREPTETVRQSKRCASRSFKCNILYKCNFI